MEQVPQHVREGGCVSELPVGDVSKPQSPDDTVDPLTRHSNTLIQLLCQRGLI